LFFFNIFWHLAFVTLVTELHEMITVYFAYLDKMIADFIKPLPAAVAKLIADLGLKGALDATYFFTERYTPKRFIDELHGIADGAGINWQDIRRLNMLPELTQAHCTIIGAWGVATATKGLLQVRALDWDATAPISKFPSITVYHPSEAKSQAVANIGFVGLVGSITAYSNASIGLSEKVWLSRTEHNLTSRFGKPWTFVLRDAAQFATDVDSAINMFINTQRTAAIFIGVGDSVNQNFRGVQYSARELDVVDWSNIYEDEYHPRLRDVVYWDKHVQPSGDHCTSSLLQNNHGKYTPEFLISQVLPLAKTGDVQACVFDFLNNHVYVSYNVFQQQPAFAYQRTYVRLDMNKIFKVAL